MGSRKNDQVQVSGRNAGVLLHITSLPSLFGIGDLGPEAKRFANFLHQSKQSYWQVLPLNPTESDQGYSPYSATSSMAGNTLLISPEWLVTEDLLMAGQVEKFKEPSKKKADFHKSRSIKEKFFDAAYANFLKAEPKQQTLEFTAFCEKEAHWLNDYALYVILKKKNKGNPWHMWPEAYKLRTEDAISEFEELNEGDLNKEKWLQFIFFKQWGELKEHCNNLGIRIFGDLPFYVSYDSADVWSHQEIFKLDKQGKMMGVAGVPPDYFNENGQLWGMPVFHWQKLQDTDYAWWVQRIEKNLELFDLLRLDHFRAFSSYWEVPAEESTAINGQWKEGPGSHFFNFLKKKIGTLPFVAEDLGDIDDAVYHLRDEFNFPGMKVLQFAFDGDMARSEHIPHNYGYNFIAYTGTHDNNTSRAWFRDDLSSKGMKNLQNYLGKHLDKKNIHQELSKAALGSVAKTVVLPMQDLLGLGKKSRMNTPATTEANWLWRLKPNAISKKLQKRLKKWTRMYNRAAKSFKPKKPRHSAETVAKK